MKKILVVESSPRGEESISRKLTAELVGQLRAKHPGSPVKYRDLTVEPFPHIEQAQLAGFFTAPEQRDLALREAVQLSDTAVHELLEADVVVIGAPVWNFGIPSVLKAWIDHIVRSKLTFAYGPAGPQGLLSGKQVYVAKSSGAVFSEGPAKTMDFNEPYLRAVLGFIGLTDVHFIRAEGLNDPRFQTTALESAFKQIDERFNHGAA